MRTYKFHLLAITLLIGLSIVACKKVNNLEDSLTGTESAIVQDAEAQDAQADNVDQSIDNVMDAMETNGFSAEKSAMVGAPSIEIDHPDTTYFPKVITITFNTDTVINDERFTQTGTITITVERTSMVGSWRNSLKRTIEVTDFTTANDSASFTVNGTRIMTRQALTVSPVIKTLQEYLKATSLRVSALDSINSNFEFTVTCGNYNGTFTRIVKRTRQAMAHFEKVENGVFWHQILLNDTLIIKGSVTGKNLMDSVYSRVIDDNDPIIFTRCARLTPIISSGKLYVTRETPQGEKSATITYSNNGCITIVNVTTSNGKTKTFERKLNRKYKRWW